MNVDHVTAATVERLRSAVHRERLLATATKLIETPSPTGQAGAAADRLQEILEADGFDVERPEASWPSAPAVACRWGAAEPGRILQFNGHLDTVHLDFVPPRLEDGVLFGSGAADMKGGIAAMVEAARVLRQTNTLHAGGLLLTAHDLHEAPWGDGSQLDALIDRGYLGDGVLLPEYCAGTLPVIGRGLAVLQVDVRRGGESVHEVLGGSEVPSVIHAGAEVIRRLGELDQELSSRRHAVAGRESIFLGQAAGGEIYNQAPTEFRVQGTRRWLPETDVEGAERQFLSLLEDVAKATGTTIEGRFRRVRDAFQIDPEGALAIAFQTASRAVMGAPLPTGAKPFVDDGNTFTHRGGVQAITHGPDAKGAHTLKEWVSVDELERVALVYAVTAVAFCGGGG